MNSPAIALRGLTRYYGQRCVVDALDLEVPRGSILGFLGPNGSGKSTAIRMMLGLVEPTRGSASVLGFDSRHLPREARARIGYLAEGHHVYGWMTVAECGRFQAAFYPRWNPRIFEAVIRHFRLEPRAKAGALSRGQRAGLCLALTLAPEPELLILDDPSLGLDPVARRSLLEAMLYVTRAEGRTVLFSSHLLSDVERVADRVAVLNGGVLRACCTIETFRESISQLRLRFDGPAPALPAMTGLLRAFRPQPDEMVLTFVRRVPAVEETLRALPGLLEGAPAPLDLEEAFIRYIDQPGADQGFFLHELSEPMAL